MPWSTQLIYYPASVLLMAGIGFAFGYFVCTSIIAYHARRGTEPPFAPFLATPRQWGVWFGVMLALVTAAVHVIIAVAW